MLVTPHDDESLVISCEAMVKRSAFVFALAIFATCACQRRNPFGPVRATFVGANGETIFKKMIALDDLPDTFRVDTTMVIRGRSWSVLRAEPSTKEAMARTGRVTITLATVEYIDPGALLFSLPTIAADTGGAVGNAPPSDAFFQIAEDDWRQSEFVAVELKAQVLQELADISEIRSKHSNGVGFDKIHVRKRLPRPLGEIKVGLDTLREAMPASKTYRGVAFRWQRGTVRRSFAWTSGAMTLFGVADDRGHVRVLCAWFETVPIPATVTQSVTRLANDYGLVFVDWVSQETLPKLQ